MIEVLYMQPETAWLPLLYVFAFIGCFSFVNEIVKLVVNFIR